MDQPIDQQIGDNKISDELGDVLWYCAALATDLNLTLGAVAGENLNKLSARKEAGTIGGSGRQTIDKKRRGLIAPFSYGLFEVCYYFRKLCKFI